MFTQPITRFMKCSLLFALALTSGVSDAAVDAKTKAVTDAIAASSSCKALGDFYWEMGDASGALTTGQVGTTYKSSTVVNLASASKWPFATYFVQKFGAPTNAQVQALTMRAGYDNMNDVLCAVTLTVRGCFNAPTQILPIGNNMRDSNAVDKFDYNSGNFQKVAVDAGLGGMSSYGLASDMRKVLGVSTSSELTYAYPGIASGLHMSANSYTAMLRKIMTNQLAMGSMLELGRTCTLQGVCPTAMHSPIVHDWDYGLGHWIEYESAGNDQAYSSIGYNGFYPWITTDLQYYGVLSLENSFNIAPQAVLCGRELRKAWLAAPVQ
jgi:hypothetical protein